MFLLCPNGSLTCVLIRRWIVSANVHSWLTMGRVCTSRECVITIVDEISAHFGIVASEKILIRRVERDTRTMASSYFEQNRIFIFRKGTPARLSTLSLALNEPSGIYHQVVITETATPAS
jgi:hypothetical protein